MRAMRNNGYVSVRIERDGGKVLRFAASCISPGGWCKVVQTDGDKLGVNCLSASRGSQVTRRVDMHLCSGVPRIVCNSRIPVGGIIRSSTNPTVTRGRETEICVKYISLTAVSSMVKRSREDSDSASDAILEAASPVAASSPVKPLHSTKYVELDNVEANSEVIEVMRCSLPPHRQAISFASFEAYEVHYAKAHVNRCSECRKNFPTEHFLSLHIGENHDPLNEVRKARGEKTVSINTAGTFFFFFLGETSGLYGLLQYACFVEDCGRKCSTPQKRRMHLIDKHMFPKV